MYAKIALNSVISFQRKDPYAKKGIAAAYTVIGIGNCEALNC